MTFLLPLSSIVAKKNTATDDQDGAAIQIHTRYSGCLVGSVSPCVARGKHDAVFVRQQVKEMVTRWGTSQRNAPLVSFFIEHQELVSSERDVVILKDVHACKKISLLSACTY